MSLEAVAIVTSEIVVTAPPTSIYCNTCFCLTPDEEVVRLRCSDNYCDGCLEKLFATALKDEIMFPPSCCGVEVKLNIARHHIARSVIKEYEQRWLELRTQNKTYCWKVKCSTFIAPHSVHNFQAICQKCHARTCSKCKNAWHYGPCIEGDDAPLFACIRSEGWKKCPQCLRVIEKNEGCDHVLYVNLSAGDMECADKKAVVDVAASSATAAAVSWTTALAVARVRMRRQAARLGYTTRRFLSRCSPMTGRYGGKNPFLQIAGQLARFRAGIEFAAYLSNILDTQTSIIQRWTLKILARPLTWWDATLINDQARRRSTVTMRPADIGVLVYIRGLGHACCLSVASEALIEDEDALSSDTAPRRMQ